MLTCYHFEGDLTMFSRAKLLVILLAAVALVAVGCTSGPTPAPATVTTAPATT